ncbi:MAG: hypothetical protein KGJ13_12105, partial [Patescibacteria group bacterium]|nr:hypothetical protein [Patescibacteria group bacterium]
FERMRQNSSLSWDQAVPRIFTAPPARVMVRGTAFAKCGESDCGLSSRSDLDLAARSKGASIL